MNSPVPSDTDAADDKTPIQNQDLEHRPTPETRVPNKGLKVEPPVVGRPPEPRDLDKEERKAKEAVEEFERSVRNQVPG